MGERNSRTYKSETAYSRVEPAISDCCPPPLVHSLSPDLCIYCSTLAFVAISALSYSTSTHFDWFYRTYRRSGPSPVGHPFHRGFSTFPTSTVLTQSWKTLPDTIIMWATSWLGHRIDQHSPCMSKGGRNDLPSLPKLLEEGNPVSPKSFSLSEMSQS